MEPWHLAGTISSSLEIFFCKVDLAFDICLVELASPLVESEVVGFAELPATAEVQYEDIQCTLDCQTIGRGEPKMRK